METKEKRFGIYLNDVGDMSVGIPVTGVLEARICDDMVEHLRENKLLDDFKTKLKALIDEYYEPETGYEIFDDDDIEAEARYEEEQAEFEREIAESRKLAGYKYPWEK